MKFPVSMRYLRVLTLYSLLSLVFVTLPSLAEDEGAEEKTTATYVKLGDPFVVNFGSPVKGNLKFLKASLSIRVDGNQKADLIEKHTPYLRNEVVMILTALPEPPAQLKQGTADALASIKASINAFLKEEEGVENAAGEVLFTDFITQR